MISGVHALRYSPQPEALRAFLRDTLGWAHVDSGGGWLIFAMPPTEIAVHPTDGAPSTELYLMCDDVEATVAELRSKGVEFEGGIEDQGWGRVTSIRLPDGSSIGLYQPQHPTAIGLR
jgi:predicted enzyme related to lactoylglutathione lyase